VHSGQVLTIFVITLAAAEVGVALAVVLLLFRTRGDVDLRSATELGEAREWVP
jgi:NADH-quinone oxidoreductase subunit K